MTAALSIRQAHLDDAPALIEFNRAMARETERKDLPLEIITVGVESVLRNPAHGFYLVAECGGKVVGALLITYEWSDWRNRVFWWIQSVYVRQENRRQGAYRKLYEHVKQKAARDGNVCGFRLYVEKQNFIAQKTYRDLGMSEAHYVMYEEML